jgi:hypothetical protein
MTSMTRLAFGAVLAAGLVLTPQAGAQSEQQGRPDRRERGERMDPQQRTKYGELRESMRKERGQRGEGRRGGPPPRNG